MKKEYSKNIIEAKYLIALELFDRVKKSYRLPFSRIVKYSQWNEDRGMLEDIANDLFNLGMLEAVKNNTTSRSFYEIIRLENAISIYLMGGRDSRWSKHPALVDADNSI